jgi:succinate-acetate transporter protein
VSVNDDRITGAGERATPAVATSAAPIADPAPLGAAAFALTTFLLSAANAGWMTKATGAAWLPYALAYGGVIQLLAAMWEFRNKNVFGTTLFGSYGGFWIGLGLYVILVERNAPASPLLKAAYLAQVPKDLAWILLAFAIFNTYMLLISTQTNLVLFATLLLLEATLILLFIGNFTASTGTIKAGGYVGVATAVFAWYLSAAGVTNGIGGRIKMPVGRPLIS